MKTDTFQSIGTLVAREAARLRARYEKIRDGAKIAAEEKEVGPAAGGVVSSEADAVGVRGAMRRHSKNQFARSSTRVGGAGHYAPVQSSLRLFHASAFA